MQNFTFCGKTSTDENQSDEFKYLILSSNLVPSAGPTLVISCAACLSTVCSVGDKQETPQWVKKGRVKLQEAGFRCCCEYQWDAARFYFQGTTGTPGGCLASHVFTLCSGHRTEKFSSFNTQPERTHKKKSGSDLFPCQVNVSDWVLCASPDWMAHL